LLEEGIGSSGAVCQRGEVAGKGSGAGGGGVGEDGVEAEVGSVEEGGKLGEAESEAFGRSSTQGDMA